MQKEKELSSLLVRIDKETKMKLKLLCVKDDVPMAAKVEELIKKYVNEMSYLIK